MERCGTGGVVENIESLIAELASLEEFVIDESALFRVALVSSAMFTLASSVMLVLLSVIFNLISDLTGGIRFTVIEEERVRTVRRVQARAERISSSCFVAHVDVEPVPLPRIDCGAIAQSVRAHP